jgi:hypothetical protein
MEQGLQVPNKTKFELDLISQEHNVPVSRILGDAWRSYKYFCNEGMLREYLLVKDDEVLLVKDQLELFDLSVQSDFMTYLNTEGVAPADYALAELFAKESEDFHGIHDYTRAALAFFIALVSKFKEGYAFKHAEGSINNVFDNALLFDYSKHYQLVA